MDKLDDTKIYPYLYILLVIPFIIIYFVYPFVFSTGISFTDWGGLKPLSIIRFIGVEEYIRLFKDEIFLRAFKNTAIYTILALVIGNVFGFLHAVVLFYSGMKFTKVWRAIIFFPTVLSPVVVGLIWNIILSQEGLLNKILGRIGLDMFQMIWLGNKVTPIYMVVLVNAWQWTGYNMILYYAGLQSINEDLIDSAKIDGANWFQISKNILIPLLAPIITIVIVLNTIGGFKVFDVVYVMTRGGPAHYSEVISTYLYYHSFSPFVRTDMSYTSTIATVLTIIIFIFSYLRIRFSREETER